MTWLKLILLGLSILLSLDGYATPGRHDKVLSVYAYDSFMAKDGLGPKVVPIFEKSCACQVKIVSVGNAGQLLGRIQLDEKRKKPVAHVVIGLDTPTWQLFEPHAASWGTWTPKGFEKLRPEARRKTGFLPFDYGFLGFMQDREQLQKLGLATPRSLRDLLDPKWKRRILLQDPRTSTPGLAFALFVRHLFPNDFERTLRQFRPQWLTITPGWDGAYGLFLKGEAPLVWSYTTSQAYHAESDKKSAQRYETVVFEEGQPMQVEGAALVAATLQDPQQRKLAEAFLEFLISPEVQRLIPLHNWMYPAREDVELPASFKNIPKPKKVIPLSEDRAFIEETLKRWQGALH